MRELMIDFAKRLLPSLINGEPKLSPLYGMLRNSAHLLITTTSQIEGIFHERQTMFVVDEIRTALLHLVALADSWPLAAIGD
jgi:hypothetical protein